MSEAAAVDVSIVVPCYQGEEFLAATLDALLQQSHDSFEIIVIDDASTDATAAIAARYAAQDARVRFESQAENQGVAAARERAVAIASGRYVWLVDADDEWPTTAVATLIAAADRTAANVVIAGAVTVSPDGATETPVGTWREPRVTTGAAAFRALLHGDVTGHLWNKLIRRSLFTGIDFTHIRQHSDQAQIAQLLSRADTVAVISDQVYRYKLRAGSIIRSGSRRADSLAALIRTVAAAADRVDPALRSSREFAYYAARFNLLSRFKDATSGAYSSGEARRILSAARREVSVRHFAALVRRRDVKHTILLATGTFSRPAYELIMKRGGRI